MTPNHHMKQLLHLDLYQNNYLKTLESKTKQRDWRLSMHILFKDGRQRIQVIYHLYNFSSDAKCHLSCKNSDSSGYAWKKPSAFWLGNQKSKAKKLWTLKRVENAGEKWAREGSKARKVFLAESLTDPWTTRVLKRLKEFHLKMKELK